jgi:hypothetical protein
MIVDPPQQSEKDIKLVAGHLPCLGMVKDAMPQLGVACIPHHYCPANDPSAFCN